MARYLSSEHSGVSELAEGEPAYDRESLWHALTGEGDPYVSGPGDLHTLAQYMELRQVKPDDVLALQKQLGGYA